jgi:pimeloyl-ACP methyl ester carboxylesterase
MRSRFRAIYTPLHAEPFSALALAGDADNIDPAVFKNAAALHLGGYQVQVLPRIVHFIPQEVPDLVSEYVIGFLGKPS